MDQTDFSLLIGFLVGSHAGAFSVHHFFGTRIWVSYLTGGVIGIILTAAFTFWLVGFIARRRRP